MHNMIQNVMHITSNIIVQIRTNRNMHVEQTTVELANTDECNVNVLLSNINKAQMRTDAAKLTTTTACLYYNTINQT